LLKTDVFVNRGIMHGAWLPIYGVGGVLLIVLLKRSNPLACFGFSLAICSIVEYFTSWILEIIFHTRWWDYSGEFMNLDGRICLSVLLVFSVVGCLMVCVFAPLINRKIITLPRKFRIVLCAALGIVFTVDLLFSAISPNIGVGISSVI
jgi:uncharacterized membrane protein